MTPRGFLPLVPTALLLLASCGAAPRNLSFDLTLTEAKKAMEAMAEEPVALERPLVIVGGFADPGVASSNLARRLRRTVSNPDLVTAVAFFTQADFDECRDRLIDRVQATWPSDDPATTIEVDVAGISMGGLVARYAGCTPLDGSRRLRIARLFTIATPHRGAELAALPTFDDKVIDMRAGSAFLALLRAAEVPDAPVIIPYARLGDAIVGEEHTSPGTDPPWWVSPPALEASHLQASSDTRIIADIARRLRREEPFTTPPAAEFP